MPRPSKTVNAIQGHRTKAELNCRREAEDSLKTNARLTERPETRADKTAHKEFGRVKKLFALIDKDDDLYSAVLNRYCQIQAECLAFEKRAGELQEQINRLKLDYEDGKTDAEFYYSKYDSLQKTLISIDRQVMTKRKMLFDIEKENLMTVASSLRSVPKAPQPEENPLIKALASDDDD